jgi:preprotein translocase subunit SecE
MSWFQDFRQYLLDVRAEFEKISWPSQKEYVGGTIGVLVIVALMTLILGVLDGVLSAGFAWLTESLPKLLNG